MDPETALARIAETFGARVHPAARRAFYAFVLFALVGGGLIARAGTTWTRLGGAALILAVIALYLAQRIRVRRDLARREGLVRRVIRAADTHLGEALLRALALEQRAATDPNVGSLDLARAHVRRTLGRVPSTLVERRGVVVAKRYRVAAFCAVAAGVGLAAHEPSRVLEGLDVLVARNGRAPIAMEWVEGVTVTSHPPAYLRSSERRLFPGLLAEEPKGSVIVVRGVPRKAGRNLVLTDGEKEVPFSDDAESGVVARFTLEKDHVLRVAARFGSVVIREPSGIALRAVPDEAPRVVLEGAPRTVELASLERLELRYEAEDDHGLRQIDLVMRSGGKEERRPLEKLDGQLERKVGAHALDPSDRFLRRMFLPVLISVEARDDDATRSSKWGASETITLMPPVVGEGEAARYRALVEARDALLDLIVASEAEEPAPANAVKNAAAARERRLAALKKMKETVATTFRGLPISPGLSAFLLGQVRVLEKTPKSKSAEAKELEGLVLAVDAAVRSLSTRDARSVATRLGDVAEEAAEGFEQARVTEKQRVGLGRADVALRVLDQGALHLLALGELGRDLGSVTTAEIRRVRRAEQGRSLLHAELAARHLAARLRRPNPSFGSASGSGGGGVESGAPRDGNVDEGSPSDADQRFDELADELSELSREHRALIEQVEREIAEAENAARDEELRREAERRAQALREAVENLPRSSSVQGSGRAAAALAREHAQAMAGHLERLELGSAIESGKTSQNLASEAKQKAREPQSTQDLSDPSALERAERELAEQLAWAEAAQARLARAVEESAKKGLAEAAEGERSIARRAQALAEQGDSGERSLPAEALEQLQKAREAMDAAARELGESRGEPGLEQQRTAQRLLEQASSGRTSDSEKPSPSERDGEDGEDGRVLSKDGEVPRADDKVRAEEFRRRVLNGLSKDQGGRLSPAIRRYAEGLLR
jgi:hypothetical protein